MISLQQFFGKDEKFYALMEASADEARHSVEALTRVLSDPNKIPSLAEFRQSKEADKRITEQISEALLDTFVTQLDREDIEALSETLYKIPKTVEKLAERFIVSASVVRDTDFASHVVLLDTATSQIVAMVTQLRRRATVATIKQMNGRLQQVEGDADKLILHLLQDLYSGKYDATKVTALKDLYELLEKIIDRCRDVGNVVTHIVLKHS